MDLAPYVFLVLIVLMSGGIAVLADDVGRRIGKKRLHVRGMRPKRVAQLGTFIAGILVSLCTILIVAGISSDVRQWIREGNQAIRRAKEAEARAKDAEDQEATTKRTLAAIQRQTLTLKGQNRSLNTETNLARQQLDIDKGEEARLNKRLASIRTRLTSLRQRFSQANERIAGLNQEVTRRKASLVASENRLRLTNSALKTVNERLPVVVAQEARAKGELAVMVDQKHQTDDQNQALLVDQKRLRDEKSALEDARASARAQYVVAVKDLDSAKLELASTKTELASTQHDLVAANDWAKLWQEMARAPRIAPPIYLRGDEVARMAIPAGLSFARSQSEVTSLLRLARVQAKEHGAAGHGSYAEALVVGHLNPDTGASMGPDELENQVAERIAGAPESMVLVASSSFNAFKGEPVSLEIEAMPNPIVFPRNTLVAKADVDGRLETDVIFRQLSALGQKVEQRASEGRMIPHLGSSMMYGAVSSDEVLHLVNEVKATNRAVEVRAFADADTRAGDPLKLRFSVR